MTGLCDEPCRGDLRVGVRVGQRGPQPDRLPAGEPVVAALQDSPCPIQRTGAIAVADESLLDTAADLLHRQQDQLDDVECVGHPRYCWEVR